MGDAAEKKDGEKIRTTTGVVFVRPAQMAFSVSISLGSSGVSRANRRLQTRELEPRRASANRRSFEFSGFEAGCGFESGEGLSAFWLGGGLPAFRSAPQTLWLGAESGGLDWDMFPKKLGRLGGNVLSVHSASLKTGGAESMVRR